MKKSYFKILDERPHRDSEAPSILSSFRKFDKMLRNRLLTKDKMY